MINEQLSAYLDGEASPEEIDNLVAALKRDETLRRGYSRQHWIRHALRENQPVALDAGFADRVMANLGTEFDTEDEHPNVAPIGGPGESRGKSGSAFGWRRPTAGLAIAASVVGALVLVANPPGNQQGSDVAPSSITQQAAATPATAASPEVRVQSAAALPAARATVATTGQQQYAPADHWTVGDPELENQLNGYLLEHSGVARGYGMSGATPGMIRVATYGSGQ